MPAGSVWPGTGEAYAAAGEETRSAPTFITDAYDASAQAAAVATKPESPSIARAVARVAKAQDKRKDDKDSRRASQGRADAKKAAHTTKTSTNTRTAKADAGARVLKRNTPAPAHVRLGKAASKPAAKVASSRQGAGKRT